MRKKALLIDALVNAVLGVLLLWFPSPLIRLLGAPVTQPPFYASVFGGVLLGIALALVWEAYRKAGGAKTGLGLVGAAMINICGGLTLAGWLAWGELGLAIQGVIILWALVIGLIGFGIFELVLELMGGDK